MKTLSFVLFARDFWMAWWNDVGKLNPGTKLKAIRLFKQ
jgi:hypothetical protein